MFQYIHYITYIITILYILYYLYYYLYYITISQCVLCSCSNRKDTERSVKATFIIVSPNANKTLSLSDITLHRIMSQSAGWKQRSKHRDTLSLSNNNSMLSGAPWSSMGPHGLLLLNRQAGNQPSGEQWALSAVLKTTTRPNIGSPIALKKWTSDHLISERGAWKSVWQQIKPPFTRSRCFFHTVFFLLNPGSPLTAAHRWAETRRWQTRAAGERPNVDSTGKFMNTILWPRSSP